jgi:hypothetical protein
MMLRVWDGMLKNDWLGMLHFENRRALADVNQKTSCNNATRSIASFASCQQE